MTGVQTCALPISLGEIAIVEAILGDNAADYCLLISLGQKLVHTFTYGAEEHTVEFVEECHLMNIGLQTGHIATFGSLVGLTVNESKKGLEHTRSRT